MKEKNKRNEFGRAARIAKKVNIKIEELEKNRKKPFTAEEKRRRIRWETKKELRKSNIRAFIVAIAGTMVTGIGTTALLSEGNKEIKKSKNEISIDVGNKDKDIKIKNMPDDRNIFVDGIKVNTKELKEREDKELENNVKEDIESLKTREEILNYIKEIYVDEYNKQNNDNINKNQIVFSKIRQDKKVSQDKAKNGDMILRKDCSNDNDKKYLDISTGVITAIIDKGDAKFYETIMNYNNKIQTVYDSNETVEKYEDNVLVKVGDVVDKGIDWSTAKDETENDWITKDKYKQRFIEAVKEYKERQIEEIKQPRINNDENEQVLE